MITLAHGDILKADAEALVNTVNCVGVMGRGIALQFRKAFPDNFKEYEGAAKRGFVEPGKMFVHRTGRLSNPKFIINFPTKRHWRGRSQMRDIESGLIALIEEVRTRNIKSIAVPPLGCGLGGLDWDEVRPRIENAFAQVPTVQTLLYPPEGAPSADVMVRSTQAPAMTPGRAAILALLDRYRRSLLDPFISLLEIHKLTYFLQEAGQTSLNLKFQKALYGPYAENLRQQLLQMEGYMISGYADGGDAPSKPIELVPGAAEEAAAFLTDYFRNFPASQARFERVAQLVDGFESPFGLELLATVHWVASKEGAASLEEATRATYAWNSRKRVFSQEQIALARKALVEQGWLLEAA